MAAMVAVMAAKTAKMTVGLVMLAATALMRALAYG